jgi:GNAT superfamily N-acetyltransferase
MEKARLQFDTIVAFLSQAYWAQGRTRDVIERSIVYSLCFGLYAGDRQIGFARVVTDCTTFAYLCDVFIGERYRGQCLGKWLMAAVMGHLDPQGLRRWTLATRMRMGYTGSAGGRSSGIRGSGWRSTIRHPCHETARASGVDGRLMRATGWRAPKSHPHGSFRRRAVSYFQPDESGGFGSGSIASPWRLPTRTQCGPWEEQVALREGNGIASHDRAIAHRGGWSAPAANGSVANPESLPAPRRRRTHAPGSAPRGPCHEGSAHATGHPPRGTAVDSSNAPPRTAAPLGPSDGPPEVHAGSGHRPGQRPSTWARRSRSAAIPWGLARAPLNPCRTGSTMTGSSA